MTDMTLALKLIADATSAVAGLQKVTAAVQQTGAAAATVKGEAAGLGPAFGGAGQQGGAAFDQLVARMAPAQREIDLLKTKLAAMGNGPLPKLRDDFDGVGRAARGSAGQVGNLVAQFNDIGMMMAAGQNPLMTAIQQGSQVGQVLGPMGAAGAAKALGGAVMGLLNPMNLGVMAAIALGSALVQWLFSAGEETRSLEDSVADLNSAVKDFETAAGRSLADLQKEFGEVTPEVIRMNQEMADLAGVRAILAATEAMQGLRAETEGSWWAAFTDKAFTDTAQTAAMLGVDQTVMKDGRQRPNPVVGEFQAAVEVASLAQGVDAQLAAFAEVNRIIIEAAGGIYSMTTEQTKLLAKVDQTEAALRRQKAAATSGITPQGGRAEAGYEPTRDDTKAWTDYLAARKAATATTREEVAENQRLAALQQVMATYGEDSAQVALARLTSERDLYAAQLNQRRVAGGLKDDALDAWDAAEGMAGAQKAAADEMDRAREAGQKVHEILVDAWDATIGLDTAAPGSGWMDNAISGVDALIGRLGDAWLAARLASGPIDLPGPLDGPAGMGQSPPSGGAVSTSIRPGRREVDFDAGTGSGTGTSPGGGGSDRSNPLAMLQDQAREAMVQLDQSIAAINEKVAVGLTSTAEAADGITSAKEQAANELAELIAQLDSMGPAGAASAAELRVALQGMADDLKGVGAMGETIGKSLGESLKSPLADFILGTKTATQAFDDFVGGMAQTIATKLANRFTDSIVTPFLDSVIGSIFPGFKLFAQGGVPGLSEFSNQVLDGPTLFAMPGGGLGQAGEAGREAIIPLKDGAGGPAVRAWMGGDEVALGLMRGPDGNLGVRLPEWQSPVARAPRAFATGGVPGRGDVGAGGDILTGSGAGAGQGGKPGGNLFLTINNNAQNTEVTQTERMQGDDRFVTVMIDTVRNAIADDIIGGRGPVPAAITGTYGVRRMGR